MAEEFLMTTEMKLAKHFSIWLQNWQQLANVQSYPFYIKLYLRSNLQAILNQTR